MIKKFTILFLFVIMSFISATGQDKKAVEIDFFTRVKRISNLKVQDGNIFFTITQANRESNNYSTSLYQLIDSKPVRLAKDVSNYFFRDGGIIFQAVREDKDREDIRKGEQLTVFQKLSQGFGEADEWLRLPFRAGNIEWIENDVFFYTTQYDHNFEQLLKESKGNRKDALKKKDENKIYHIYDELPFWSNGRGDVSGLRTHLYFYNKGESKLLSDTLESASSLKLSPDKKTLVYTKRPAYYGKQPEGNILVTLNVATLQSKEWNLFEKASYGGAIFLNNNEIVLTINRSAEHGRIENSGIYRLNIQTGKLTEIYSGSPYGIGNSIGTDIGGGRAEITFDEKGLRFVTTDVDYAPLVHLAFNDAKITHLSKGRATITEYQPWRDGFLAVAFVEQQGSEIYFIDKNGDISPLTEINKPVFDEYNIAKPVEVKFTNESGVELRGYVLPPAGYVKGAKYPAILDIHGGPKTAYGTVFFHEMQYWANQGYAVFFTNPTGSSGRGSEFSDIRGKVGGIDYRDLMAFTDAVLKQVDFIDETRLGLTGGSYGGLMTNWIIGQTDRFKAAASQRGISSWLSFSNTSDIGYSFTYNYWGTDIWKNAQLLWDYSPLKHADKVKTPTLFIHSEQDYRCWLVEGLQMYYALQYFQTPSRIVIFDNENHELSRSGKPLNRIKRLSEITEWFDKYLK
ncbi:MAG: S9 family peptidase [Prevotellaceae bacterium]|nr:S9 family peptidase [Prevotellaceae bacterium]